MKFEDICRALKEAYPFYLVSFTENTDEACLEIDGELVDICRCLMEKFHISLLSLFANDESKLGKGLQIYYAFSIDGDNKILYLKYPVLENKAVKSISSLVPAAMLYEMEIRDLFGISFAEHPDERKLIFHGGCPEAGYPLRKDFVVKEKTAYGAYQKSYLQIQGTGVFEIPVGPVHAGIIEPGHFRFSVAGEPIINLEAELYYVHKGIEKLAEQKKINYALLLAERISGDETFSNSLAFCLAVEKIAGLSELPIRVEYSRVIFAEMERIYNHLGDIAGVCTDVAYGFASSQFAVMRRWCQMVNEQITGSRFLRNVNKPGGLRRDNLLGKETVVKTWLDKLEKEFLSTVKILKQNSLYIDRVENTGILKKEIALDLHAVGPAARAAGIRRDARKQFPYAAYKAFNFTIPNHQMGDVNCRVNVKIEEVLTSIQIIRQAMERMPANGDSFLPLPSLTPYAYAAGITESPRGENIHWVMAGPENTICRYKVRTPSFCNWPALCHAVKGNIVPDFPLINKSFNLSYSGNDL